MPLQVLPSPPPVTGYSVLGDTIGRLGSEYEQRARQDQLLAQARSNQLADIENRSKEGDKDFARNLAARREDIGSQRTYEDKVRGETQGFQRDQMEDQYLYGEAAKIADETRRLAAQRPDKDSAQQYVDDAAKQLTSVRAESRRVSQIALSDPPQVEPNSAEVRNLAQQLAGGSKKKEEIDAMVPKAVEQMNGLLLLKHAQQVKAAQQVFGSLKENEKQLTDIVQQGMSTFHVSPSTPPPGIGGPSALSDDTGPMRQMGTGDLAGALSRVIGPQAATAQAPGGPGAQLLDNPTANPVIDRGNAELMARQSGQQQAALNAALAQREAIAQQLAQAPAAKRPTLGMGLGGMSVTQFSDPAVAGQQTANLLKQQAMNEAQIKQLQAAVTPGAALGPVAPAVNTATSSTPVAPVRPRAPIFQTPDWLGGNGP